MNIEVKTKKNSYDLFCLLKKKDIVEFANGLKKIIGDQQLTVKEENFEMAYKIKEINEDYQYITFFFESSSEEVQVLKDYLRNTRHILLNTDKKKNKGTIKLKNDKTKQKEKITNDDLNSTEKTVEQMLENFDCLNCFWFLNIKSKKIKKVNNVKKNMFDR